MALNSISTAELVEAADANFVVHATWALGRTSGMCVHDRLGVVLTDSGLACDSFNIACRARFTPDTAGPGIRDALTFFRRAGRPFSWWVGPGDRPPDLGDRLVAAGLAPCETEVAMAADLTALPTAGLSPEGLEIRKVRTAQELRAWAGMGGDPQVLPFYERTGPALLAPDSSQAFYLGCLNGTPVATAELTVGGGGVGLYGIFTREGYRRRGIGTAMTLRPLSEALGRGLRTAVLQAAADGVGVYTRIGFQSFGQITEYKPPPTERS